MGEVRFRFAQGAFAQLRQRLLAQPDLESFALLFARRHACGNVTVFTVFDQFFPRPEDYRSRGLSHLRLSRQYVYNRLVDLQQGGRADTLIDVHTHPFCQQGVVFSATDDADERAFHRWLTDTVDAVHYGSIVLSQSDYSARLWLSDGEASYPVPAVVRTQTAPENWPCAGDDDDHDPSRDTAFDPDEGFLARGVLALGLEHMRQIAGDQCIAVVGVGGLGSVIAEHLIHSGFHDVLLLDHDRLELSNLNRIVGAGWQDALDGRLKVEAVREHLLRINPRARVDALPWRIEDPEAQSALGRADWLVLATDNHSSRYRAQQLALRLGIPLLSAGTNISVTDGRVTDVSGEVILARSGDGLCLNCLGRISPTLVAAEEDASLHDALARRGYVDGREVKEPAVKTLNTMVATLAVDTLINQFTGRLDHHPILVYEANTQPCIYPDAESLARRQMDCYHCA